MAAIVTTMPQSPGTTFRKVVQPKKFMPEKVWIASCNVMSFRLSSSYIIEHFPFSFSFFFCCLDFFPAT